MGANEWTGYFNMVHWRRINIVIIMCNIWEMSSPPLVENRLKIYKQAIQQLRRFVKQISQLERIESCKLGQNCLFSLET